MDDTYKNNEEYNPGKERKTQIVFHDIITDMLSNKKLNLTANELFITVGKLNIYLAFMLLRCSKKYQTEFFALLYYENYNQMRSSTNQFQAFNQILTLETL